MNGNFSEGELADISRIMEHQYHSKDCRLVVFTCFDDSTGKYVAAFHYIPNTMPGNNENSNPPRFRDYIPLAVGCFDVVEE